MTAAKAKRNTISDEASLRRLSPSITLTSTLGTFTWRIMMDAEIASGGDTIPPSRKPRASVKPGMKACDAKATTQEVKITMGKAKLMMTRFHLQNSFHDICQAASCSKGGRKIKKIRSGSMVIFENASVRLSTNPPKTSTIGYATR